MILARKGFRKMLRNRMPDKYDVIVIGLGAMGSATLYQLASRGVRALGIEQFAIPHAKGSYHGYSRMIRMAYYEHKDYVPLLRQAFSLGGLNLASWRSTPSCIRMGIVRR